MPHLRAPCMGWNIILCILLGACASTRGTGAGNSYAWDNSVDAACRNNPANCAVLTAKPASSAAGASGVVAAAIGAGVIKSSGSLVEELQASIDKALAECATSARLEVMARHFSDRGPTREECEQVVGADGRGQPVTRAMQLGVEQHEVALQCAEEKLKRLKPGGFSLLPRYRIDPVTGRAEYLSREVVEELLRQGRGAELRGSIEPDIVIHEGQPHRVQSVYDYKFPCVNTGKVSPWRRYPTGHPHEDSSQGELYGRALGGTPARVQPHVGVVR